MTSRAYCQITSLIFGVVALVHLMRAVKHWVFQVGPLMIPSWGSWLGAIVAAGLSVWGMRLARK